MKNDPVSGVSKKTTEIDISIAYLHLANNDGPMIRCQKERKKLMALLQDSGKPYVKK